MRSRRSEQIGPHNFLRRRFSNYRTLYMSFVSSTLVAPFRTFLLPFAAGFASFFAMVLILLFEI